MQLGVCENRALTFPFITRLDFFLQLRRRGLLSGKLIQRGGVMLFVSVNVFEQALLLLVQVRRKFRVHISEKLCQKKDDQ